VGFFVSRPRLFRRASIGLGPLRVGGGPRFRTSAIRPRRAASTGRPRSAGRVVRSAASARPPVGTVIFSVAVVVIAIVLLVAIPPVGIALIVIGALALAIIKVIEPLTLSLAPGPGPSNSPPPTERATVHQTVLHATYPVARTGAPAAPMGRSVVARADDAKRTSRGATTDSGQSLTILAERYETIADLTGAGKQAYEHELAKALAANSAGALPRPPEVVAAVLGKLWLERAAAAADEFDARNISIEMSQEELARFVALSATSQQVMAAEVFGTANGHTPADTGDRATAAHAAAAHRPVQKPAGTGSDFMRLIKAD
jgi:hypothetical protein